MRRVLVACLLSSFALTALAATPQPAESTPTAAPMITTGVTVAELRSTTEIKLPNNADLSSFPNPARMVLKINLDDTGSPAHIAVIQSLTPELDARVIAAVRQFRWRPAVLDNQTIPMEVNLIVQVQH